MKRAVDATLALLGLVILMPIMTVIALAVAIESGFPVLFRQVRIGRGLEPFILLKFRTMIVDHNGSEITASGDSRVTRVGLVLRSTKLDELPQLINVIKGDMSLVGPRPEVPRYVAMYEDTFRRVLTMRPGITGAASLEFADEESYFAGVADAESEYAERLLPQKLAIEETYAQNRTFLSDFGIVARTIVRILGLSRNPQIAPGAAGDSNRGDQQREID